MSRKSSQTATSSAPQVAQNSTSTIRGPERPTSHNSTPTTPSSDYTVNTHFGTDGIRGDARQFTSDFLSAVLSGLISCHGDNHFKLLIAGDTRPSTATILDALFTLATSQNITVTNLGILPTPAINFLLSDMGYDFAIDVTASHNPASSNGLKIFERKGSKSEKIPASARTAIETSLASVFQSSPKTPPSPQPSPQTSLSSPFSPKIALSSISHPSPKPASTAPIADASPEASYLAHLTSAVAPLDLSDLHIALDCANGATSPFATEAFRSLGATVDTLNLASTYTPEINHLCGSTHLDPLISHVTSHHLAFGAAFDGDGDRCLLVDHTGAIVDGDKILAILASFLNLDQLVTTVMANQGLFTWAADHHVTLAISDVGDQNVLALMRQKGISLGGEQSGHIILPGEAMGDGILTALMVARAVTSAGTTLHDLASAIPTSPQFMLNLPATPAQKPKLASTSIQHLLSDFEQKLAPEHGRLLVRPSGTEDLIRITLWGDHEPTLKSLAAELADLLQAKL